jgi:hypothetical protein
MRLDRSQRTPLTDGAPNYTPNGQEQSGDADPAWSADGTTVYTSRGFPWPPAGLPVGAVERRIYAVSGRAWYPGKPEKDVSPPSGPSGVEGVHKGSPDGRRLLLFRACFAAGQTVSGICITDTAGSYRTRITNGIGPDWNPTVPSACASCACTAALDARPLRACILSQDNAASVQRVVRR